MVDTEKVVQYFYETCFFAKGQCSLRWPSDQNWRAIQERVDALIQDVDENPISTIVPGTAHIILITGDDLRTAFQIPLDEPLNYFPSLADPLSDALKGKFSALLDQIDIPSYSAACHPRTNALAFAIPGKWMQHGQSSVVMATTKRSIIFRTLSPTSASYGNNLRFWARFGHNFGLNAQGGLSAQNCGLRTFLDSRTICKDQVRTPSCSAALCVIQIGSCYTSAKRICHVFQSSKLLRSDPRLGWTLRNLLVA